MKRILLFLIALLPFAVQAQTTDDEQPQATTDNTSVVRFGYLSYDSAMTAMPEYAIAQKKLEAQRAAFEKEMQRVEEEFNQKYELFLDGQKEFPRTILLKRHNELQDMMQRNIEFKAQARQELQKAETEAMNALKVKLNNVVATIAKKKGLAVVFNTDANACPFIDPDLGVDLQEEVRLLLAK